MLSPEDAKDRQRERTRRWFATILATTVMFLAYTMFIFGFALAADGETIFAGGVIGIALGLIPVVFFAAATVSNHAQSIRASLLAILLWFVVAAPIAVFDIPTALVAGFGAGGIVAMRHPPGHRLTYRVGAVGLCVVYVFALQRLIPAAGIMVGAILPFAAITIADLLQERQEELVA
jgi:hypothetical protein